MGHAKCFLIAASLAVVIGGCASKSQSGSPNAVGFERMEHPELLPYLLPDGTVTKQFCSYDLNKGDTDGNYTKAFVKYVDKDGEPVIFDEYGPGCLYRQQINVWREPDGKPWSIPLYKEAGKSRIKYYFDNESKPRIDMTVDKFFSGYIAPFTSPLTFMDDPSILENANIQKRFANTYYPLPFKKRLKVTFVPTSDWSRRWATWYQFTYLAYPTADGVKTWIHGEDNQAVRRQWSNMGSDPKPSKGNAWIDSQVTIPAGQTGTIFDHSGQGSIAALKFALEPYTKETFFNTNILICWDNQQYPSVSMPIGYFFGGGAKKFGYGAAIPSRNLRTLFFGFDSGTHTFYSYWPMPFWSHARIEIQNQSKEQVRITSHIETKDSKQISYPKNGSGYFCAKRTMDEDDANGIRALTVFDENGRGHVVGITFCTANYAVDGDELAYIDSSRTPQIHGDGTEDDHNQGWGGSAYQMPLWGGLLNGYQGSYRIYMNEPYIFYDNINIKYESVGAKPNGQSDVVFYYYKSPYNNGLKLTDELDVGNESSERSHSYRIGSQTWEKTITSCYDGYEKKRDYDCMTDGGRAFNGYSEFTVAINPANNGVRIRKRISRFENGLQTAIVYVDGKKVNERPWHVVQSSSAPSDQAWQDCDFQIPASYTHGKKSIKIRMEYADSAKGEINEFYYWVFCLTQNKK